MGIEAIIRRYTNQKAVYWEPIGQNSDSSTRYGDPVELDVRWTQLDYNEVGYKNRTYITRAQVMVQQDVLEGGLLWLGKLSDWLSPKPPLESEGGLEILLFKKEANRQATEFYRLATVGRSTGGGTKSAEREDGVDKEASAGESQSRATGSSQQAAGAKPRNRARRNKRSARQRAHKK